MDTQTKKASLVLGTMLYLYYLQVIGWPSLFGSMFLLFVWHSAGAHNSGRYPPQTSKIFFGDLFELQKNWERFPSWLLDLQEKYDHKTLEYSIPALPGTKGFRTIILIFTPENLQHVLKDNFSNYVKGERTQQILRDVFGEGIFAVDGQMWKQKRKMASNMFSRNLLRASADIAHEQTLKLIRNIERKVETGEVFDLAGLFFDFTIDTFVNIAFGVELGNLDREEKHPFAKAFDLGQKLVQDRVTNPIWILTEKFSAQGKQLRASCKVMDDFANKIIGAKRRAFKTVSRTKTKTKSLGADLITMFLDKCNPDATDKELRDLVMNFIIAGRDTTACALSWQHFEMLRNPGVYKEVVHEAEQIGDADVEERMTQEERFKTFRSGVPYLQAATRETLRLHPSVPKMMKFAVNDDTLPDGTEVPKGAAVTWSQFAMGHSHRVWPDRAKQYDPTRWLAPPDENGVRAVLPDTTPTCRYPVFHMMPRLCLGKPLALLEIHMVTAMLARRFSFHAAPGLSDEYRNTLVLPMKYGLPVTAKKRQL